MKVMFCLPGNSYSGRFLNSWTLLRGYCMSHGIEVGICQQYDANVYYVRAKCLGANVLKGTGQKPWNGEVAYDYIMWIDSDMVFTPEHFQKLLSRDKDIVSGIYLMADKERIPAITDWNRKFFKENGTFNFLKPADLKGDDLVEVVYIGMGFMLVRKGVYESIPYPWFDPQKFDFGDSIIDFASEDVSFCLKARQIGHKIYIDPTVMVGHEKSYVI